MQSLHCLENYIYAFELWCWRRLESPLNSKEIKPVNPKGNQLWIFTVRTEYSLKDWKGLDAGKGWGEEEKGMTWDAWMASLTQWTWIWANSGKWWRTGNPGVVEPMGSQRIGHDWVTPQQQNFLLSFNLIPFFFKPLEPHYWSSQQGHDCLAAPRVCMAGGFLLTLKWEPGAQGHGCSFCSLLPNAVPFISPSLTHTPGSVQIPPTLRILHRL